MLQSIRDRLTGPIIWVVIGMISIPFAFWGVESFKTGGGDPVIVKVGDEEITQSRFDAGYQQRYRQLQGLMGENFRTDRIDQTRFRKTVLDDMVQESLLRQYARDAGYRASNAALVGYLSTIPAFQDNGRFSPERYRSLIAAQGMRMQDFESQVRDSLVVDQLRGSIVETAFVTPRAVAAAQRLAAQSRELEVLRLPLARYESKASVSDEQLRQRYEDSKAGLMTQERLRLAFVELDLQKLALAEDPGDEVLQVLYDAEKDARFSTQEERRARHVLINFGADREGSRKKIEELAEQLKAGADFAKLAREQSDDSGSKTQGGELGWVQRGTMVKPFEDALYALAPGTVSAPVETEFGWHLIKVEEIKPAQLRPFSEPAVREELLALYRGQESTKHFQDLSSQLEQLAFENPTTLDAVVSSLSLPLQTTEWFTRAGGAGITANEAVLKAAFSPEVLEDGENSQLIAVDANRLVVLRKSEYEPARQKRYEEVVEDLRRALLHEAATEQARADAEQLRQEIAAGRPSKEAATAHGATLLYEGVIDRRSTAVPATLVTELFKLPRPAPGQPSLRLSALPEGDLVVITLRGIVDPPPAALDAPESRRTLASARDALGGAEFAAFRKSMEAAIHVEMKRDPSGPADAGLSE